MDEVEYWNEEQSPVDQMEFKIHISTKEMQDITHVQK